MTAKSKAHHKMTVADRRAKIAQCLVTEKMTIRQAAEAAGCSIGTAHKDITALRAEWAESAADLVDLERRRTLADLERLIGVCWGALTGDITDRSAMTGGQGATALLRALELKCQVLGLFAAKAPALEVCQGMILLPPDDTLAATLAADGPGLQKIHADRQPG